MAFYNTTGIVLDGRLRHRSRLFGQVRFNAMGGFNPQHVEANIGRLFVSVDIRRMAIVQVCWCIIF